MQYRIFYDFFDSAEYRYLSAWTDSTLDLTHVVEWPDLINSIAKLIETNCHLDPDFRFNQCQVKNYYQHDFDPEPIIVKSKYTAVVSLFEDANITLEQHKRKIIICAENNSVIIVPESYKYYISNAALVESSGGIVEIKRPDYRRLTLTYSQAN